MENISEKLWELITKIPRYLYLPIVLSVVGLIFLYIGLIQLLDAKTTTALSDKQEESTQQVQAHISNAVQGASTSANTFGIHIDVEGAVVNPGVYTVSQNARIQDALIAAGGLSSVADRDAVAKTLNLALRVVDGAKVYIPKVGDTSPVGEGNGSITAGSQVHLINVNTASSEELDILSGVGPVTAEKIISNRPYSSVDDLLQKKVVSSSVFQKIKNSVTVY